MEGGYASLRPYKTTGGRRGGGGGGGGPARAGGGGQGVMLPTQLKEEGRNRAE